MTCTSPIVLRREDGLRQEVPCGSCLHCRIAHSREWATRVLHENETWKTSTFTTLTYDDEHLPEGSTLKLQDLQNFIKRLRARIYPRKIRYFACGEYGENYHRPHYHIILFGVQPCTCTKHPRSNPPCNCKSRLLITDTWSKGFVARCGSVTYDSARYCADYVGKHTEEAKDFYQNKERPFIVRSIGLGSQYIRMNAAQLTEQRGITIHGAQVGLPRYYALKLGINYKDIDRPLPNIVPSKLRHVWAGPIPDAAVKAVQPRKQRSLDLEAKLNLHKKGTL